MNVLVRVRKTHRSNILGHLERRVHDEDGDVVDEGLGAGAGVDEDLRPPPQLPLLLVPAVEVDGAAGGVQLNTGYVKLLATQK